MAAINIQLNNLNLSGSEIRTMVLLVDDQPMVAEAIRRKLAGLPDIDLHYCADGLDAINQANNIKPSVILQDLVMPSIDGLALVGLYRANPGTAETPIIVLSSEEDPAIKSNAFAAGANDYLVKLPDRIELIARIRYHSRAYTNRIQRDEAFCALRESQKQLMEANLELHRLTNEDSLTGLKNRRYFDERINEEWNRSVRDKRPLSVLLIDIDGFKQYNDTHGHLAGDRVLRSIAERLRESARRPADCVARFGGEEFSVILPATPLAGAQILAEEYRQSVEDLHIPRDISMSEDYLTVSIGGATTMPQWGESFLSLLDAADKLLYQAKTAGRNRVVTRERDLSASRSRAV
jgi:two-component system chemotaxis family response regulator WspR